MYRIYIETVINTTCERCFDLSRSIDFHKASMAASGEVPVNGRMSGLIELGEFVEWEATHLMVRQRLSSKITEMVRPKYFIDEMVEGAFKSIKHRHEFISRKPDEVLMIDDFRYEVPFGIFGSLANELFLYKYMDRLLEARCTLTKNALESDQWREFISEDT